MATLVVDAEYLNDVDKARRELRSLIAKKNCAPIMLRLAWHDAGTYDAKSKTGGPNGSIRNESEYSHGANSGLKIAIDLCEEVKAKHPKITYADLYQLAGVVAVEVTGGPDISFVPGRNDCDACTDEGRLPDANQGRRKVSNILKMLSKGIDPATHRSINEQKIPNSKKTEEDQIVKDISFVAHFEKTEKSEDQNQKRNHINGFVCKEEKVIEYYPFVVEQEEEEEICPDLNLDLRISPPWQSQNLVDQGRERETYTACRFYVENGKECSSDTVKCQTEDSSSISYSSSIDISSTNNVAYDFLGLKTRVLDFRSLEMN